jgi:hypothetical protein
MAPGGRYVDGFAHVAIKTPIELGVASLPAISLE